MANKMAGVRTRPMANKPFFSDTAKMAEQLGAKPLLPTDHDGEYLPSDGVLADGTPKLVALDRAHMKHRGFDKDTGEPILDWVGGGEAAGQTMAARAARAEAEAAAAAEFRRLSLAERLQSVEERQAEALAAVAAVAPASTTALEPGGARRRKKKAAAEAENDLLGTRRGLDIADRLLVDLARRLATISAPTGAERLKLGGALHECTEALAVRCSDTDT